MFWFRRDLRLADQPALSRVGLNHVSVFYYSSYHSEDFLAPLRPSDFRSRFIHQAITELGNRLNALGLEFHRSTLNPIDEIPLVCELNGVKKVYCNLSFSWFERRQEMQLKERLVEKGVELIVEDAERFPWRPQHPLKSRCVFTDYRLKIETELALAINPSKKSTLSDHKIEIDGVNGLGQLVNAVSALDGGESHAIWRIQHFVREGGGIERYVDTRNGMLGYEYSSLLSPYLAAGCCSSAQIFEAVRSYEIKYGSTKSTYWLIFELLWRSYFKWIGDIHGHRIFLPSGYNGRKSIAIQREKHKLKLWIRGDTPEPLVNACMRELAHTGYMGNRARQIAASYLINDLQVQWTWGARYFEHMLMDYDPCSNYGNWAYLAGVGSDPRPSRRFNPSIQQENYDPDRAYVNHWIGWNAIELDEEIFEIITR